MYELFKSNEQDESLALIEGNMDYEEAMLALKVCSMPHCQIELSAIMPKFVEEFRRIRKEIGIFAAHKYAMAHSSYSLVATKHNKIITKFY